MQFAMKQVGEVAIDSGQVTIGDPCHVGDQPALCVIRPTIGGDGPLPVYEFDIAGVKYLAVRLAVAIDGLTVQEIFEQAEKDQPPGNSRF